ncbi:Trk system potassium transporter TrkA [Ruminococcus sp. OA3]|uniref:Trk system potassium transporter TrkA n=1 Tax=Ruminococcus sp. OA3 TaxID=2914164 RepID=UPI001F05D14D|nr:Trk system potassium transporter TrkA [Ruminococcus sp. OA3]MCH1981823.1 Trk system potassium transporter TrkA [Ruminococcus sp. OA3]
MNIIIAGCGKVGTVLTAQLSKEDNNICIIDKDSAVVNRLASAYDVMGITGNGASYSILAEAGIEDADLMIAVTESDELNLLCCVIAKKAGQCQTIARVRNPIYSQERQFIKDELGLSMIINPEFTAAVEISQLLCFPNAMAIDVFSKGRSEMLRFRIPENSILDQMQLKDMPARLGNDILVCAVERNHEIIIPSGSFTLQASDIVSLIASRKNAVEFFKKIRMKTNHVKNTMLIGGGKIAVYLANMLLRLGISVKIIELDPKRCEELSEMLPEATIINGDGSDEDLLYEERIDLMDSFVAMTNFDEENILLSLFAKKKVRSKVITKINRLQLNEVIHNLDLDSVVYPKHLTAEKILQYVRATQNSIGSNIETLYRLFDDRVEALEFNIQENAKITGIPLMELNLKKNLLIGCITRGDQIIIPGGQDMILPGDSVIVVTTILGLQDAQDILQE